jgi:hypothetical protein
MSLRCSALPHHSERYTVTGATPLSKIILSLNGMFGTTLRRSGFTKPASMSTYSLGWTSSKDYGGTPRPLPLPRFSRREYAPSRDVVRYHPKPTNYTCQPTLGRESLPRLGNPTLTQGPKTLAVPPLPQSAPLPRPSPRVRRRSSLALPLIRVNNACSVSEGRRLLGTMGRDRSVALAPPHDKVRGSPALDWDAV